MQISQAARAVRRIDPAGNSRIMKMAISAVEIPYAKALRPAAKDVMPVALSSSNDFRMVSATCVRHMTAVH